MGKLREWLIRAWAAVTRDGHGDERLAEELAFHREMLEADLHRQGAGGESLRREVALRVGGTAQILEAHRDQRSLPMVESVLQDIRYAARSLRRAPGFALAALLTLALGIGATTTIFTVVHAVLLRPLPFPASRDLVIFGHTRNGDASTSNLGYATFADYRDRARLFRGLAAIRTWQPTLVTTEAERLTGMRVSWNYFSLLGTAPALGRTFRPEDDHPDRYRVVVLSDGLWRRRFGADPAIVGQTIRMNDLSYEIIGVMPAGFDDVVSTVAYERVELWAALGYDASLSYGCRGCQHLKAIGRLQPSASLEEGTNELNAIHADLVRQFPGEYRAGSTVGLLRLEDAATQPVRQTLHVLLAAVGFVLLIACANVANLMLARALNRTREMAVRAALGAGRSRLIRQMVTESLVLWTLGGAAGIGLALLLVDALVAIAPGELPRAETIALNASVLAFSSLVSLATGTAFGLLPAFSATAPRSRDALASGSRSAVGSASARTRHALVVVDLAVALVLVVGAGLMLKSVSHLLHVDPGFEPERVLTAQFSLLSDRYREARPAMGQSGASAPAYAFIDRLVERVGVMPGVDAVAIAGQVPMGGNGDRFGITIEGRAPSSPAERPSPERYSVTTDYFRAMGIPLLRGRLFESTDTPSSQPVMLVSETAASTLFAGQDPIGRRVKVGGAPDAPWRTIVGIVGDVRHAKLTEAAWPQMYLPQSQFTDVFLVLVVKGSTDRVTDLVPAIRGTLRDLDPSVPLYDVARLQDLLSRSFAERRFLMLLLVGFAGVSLLLAAVGLYGVVSYTVARRTREVGVRVALGATRRDILRLVFGAVLGTAAAGLGLGLGASAILTRFLRGQLVDVQPLDPGAVAGAVATLAGVIIIAHVLPVRRALAVDPSLALRDE